MKKTLIWIIVIVAIAVVGIIAATAIVKGVKASNNNPDTLSSELTDEFSRAKYFITDWYDELSANRKCNVYLNELSFQNGQYTLTYADKRMRAIYPKGERFFKLDYVTKIEFFQVDNVLRCRFSYGENGEYMFKIN